MIIKIPIKSHVKKYLIARYGNQHTITKNTLLGLLVHDHLSKNYTKTPQKLDCHVYYEVHLTDWCFKNVGHSIDIATLVTLGNALAMLFREDLHQYVRTQLLKQQKATDAIKEFLKNYEITEDELKFETVYKDYKRKHDSIKADKHKKSLVNP